MIYTLLLLFLYSVTRAGEFRLVYCISSSSRIVFREFSWHSVKQSVYKTGWRLLSVCLQSSVWEFRSVSDSRLQMNGWR